MTHLSALFFAVGLAAPLIAQAQQHPRDREIHDPDTLAWWHTTEALSNDSMEGRDTGSAAYQRAAVYVANRFKAAGLEPAGENGGYLQSVPMHEVSVTPEGTSFALVAPDGAATALNFLQQITIAPAEDLPAELNAALTFRGYCGKDAMADIDLTQPMDFAAAAKFNTFFYDLVEAIGNAPMRPAIYPTSSFAATK